MSGAARRGEFPMTYWALPSAVCLGSGFRRGKKDVGGVEVVVVGRSYWVIGALVGLFFQAVPLWSDIARLFFSRCTGEAAAPDGCRVDADEDCSVHRQRRTSARDDRQRGGFL